MFFGLGAYTPLLFYSLWGWPPIAGIPAAILTVAALTLLSSGVARARLRETLPRLRSASAQGTQQPPS